MNFSVILLFYREIILRVVVIFEVIEWMDSSEMIPIASVFLVT